MRSPTATERGKARIIAKAVSPEVLERPRFKERLECWKRDELEPTMEMYALAPSS